jgi:hypothetical protein
MISYRVIRPGDNDLPAPTGNRGRRLKPVVIFFPTGRELEVESPAKAARILGRNINYIYRQLRLGGEIGDGITIRYTRPFTRGIVGIDANGMEHHFASVAEAAVKVATTAANICMSIDKPRMACGFKWKRLTNEIKQGRD